VLDQDLNSPAARLELHEIRTQLNMASAASWRTLYESTFHLPFSSSDRPDEADQLPLTAYSSHASGATAHITFEIVYYVDTDKDRT